MELSIILARVRSPGIVFDFVVLQLNAFMLEVLSKVLLAFGFVLTDPGWPPTGFLLNFQPGVDVVFEESFTRLVEMPDLIDVLDCRTPSSTALV